MTKEQGLTEEELAKIEKFLRTPGMMNAIKSVEDSKRAGRREMFREEAIKAVEELHAEDDSRRAKGKPELTSKEKELVLHNGSVRSQYSVKQMEEFQKGVRQDKIQFLNETQAAMDH